MGKQKPRLGRGLASLLPEISEFTTTVADPEGQAQGIDDHTATGLPRQLAQPIALDVIDPNPQQPRTQYNSEALQQLAESIKAHGIVQPILVRPFNERFQLVAGQRRYEAAKIAEMHEIPAIVRDLSDQQTLEIALVENIHREDLNCIDRAMAYQQYQERFQLSAEQIASGLGQDRTTVVNYLRLLSLTDEVKHLLVDGRINMGHARAILGLPDPQEQTRLAFKAAQLDLSVRQIEAMVGRLKSGAKSRKQDDQSGKNPNIMDLEQQMTRSLSTKVRITPGRRKGTGKITIEFYSLDDFDRILDQICGPDREPL